MEKAVVLCVVFLYGMIIKELIVKILVFIYRGFSLFIGRIQNYDRNLKLRQKMLLGTNSVVHPEAKILNLQQDRDKIFVGKYTHIRGELLVYPYGDGICIGDNCYVGEYSIIRAGNKIKIGNNVLIAHSVTLIDSDSHEIDAVQRAASYHKMLIEGHPQSPGDVKTSPILIEDNVWISYNVCILKGVTIGEGAIIGAGSVVTKDVPPWSVVAGNPARVVKLLK